MTIENDQRGCALKATIIIPVYNTEAYLPDCLASLQSQTRKDFEVVVVDDCSSGDSDSIAKFFQAHLDIEYVRHSVNLNTLRARLTGVGHARGDYIGFLDPDDSALPTFVERLLGTAEETGADIVGSAAPWAHKGAHFTLSGADQILRAYADRTICNWNVWTKFYRKALVSDLNNSIIATDRIGAGEDVVLNVFCALKNPVYVHIPEALVKYNYSRLGVSWTPASSEERQNTLREVIHAFEVINEAASDYEDSISRIIRISTKYAYQRIFPSADSELVTWALPHIRNSSVGELMMSAMFEEAVELQFAHRKRAAQLKKKLASKRKQLSRTRERLSEAQERRQRLRPILGDLWRWGLSRLLGRS